MFDKVFQKHLPQYKKSLFWENLRFIFCAELVSSCNHHDTDISVIWLVEWSATKLLILIRYVGKHILRSREISMLHYIGSTFRDSFKVFVFWRWKKKMMQCSYANTLRFLIRNLFRRDAFRLYCDWNKLMINK